jgi:hypothetical protein
MTPNITNRAGKRTPFSADRLTGTLVRKGVPASDALAYARAAQALLLAQKSTSVTTDQLRSLVADLITSKAHEPTRVGWMFRTPPEAGGHPHRSKLVQSGMFPAPFEPPLRGISTQPGPFIQKTNISPGELLGYAVSEEFFNRAKDAVIADEQVRPHLINKNYGLVSIQVVRGPNDSKQEPTLARLVIYNYTDDLTLDVYFSFHDLRVTSVKEARYQPPLSPQELNHAIQIAKGDEKITEWLTPHLTATGIQVTEPRTDQEGPYRQVMVLLGAAEDSSARFWCLVNLSKGTVCQVGKVIERAGEHVS